MEKDVFMLTKKYPRVPDTTWADAVELPRPHARYICLFRGRASYTADDCSRYHPPPCCAAIVSEILFSYHCIILPVWLPLHPRKLFFCSASTLIMIYSRHLHWDVTANDSCLFVTKRHTFSDLVDGFATLYI